MALYNYGINFLIEKGYEPIQPPYFMSKSIMEETCQLSDFEENLYKVDMGKMKEQDLPKDKQKAEDLYLIATSEQPLSGYFRKEWLETNQLPQRFAGLSTCFRKEAGAHGKETWGVFRVHQFEKVEQFIVTEPDKSWDEFTKMMETSKEFYESLGIPYRVVSIVAGGLNDAAAKKQDLEAWFPGYDQYKELVSCSNCTDYQARNLECRFRPPNKQGEAQQKLYCHMLNGTLCATTRTMSCILENYQTEDGVDVPVPLIPYMGGVKKIPYVRKPLTKKELEALDK